MLDTLMRGLLLFSPALFLGLPLALWARRHRRTARKPTAD